MLILDLYYTLSTYSSIRLLSQVRRALGMEGCLFLFLWHLEADFERTLRDKLQAAEAVKASG